MLGYEGVSRWLTQRTDIDWDVVLAAIGSHHLKFDESDFASYRKNELVRIYADHDDFSKDLITRIAARLHLTGAPTLPPFLNWGFTGDSTIFDPTRLRDMLKNGALLKLDDDCADSMSVRGRMLRAVRAALIAADAVGSGLPRTGDTIAHWVQEKFDGLDDCDEALIRDIVLQRIRQLAESDPPKWKHEVSWESEGWNQFQKDCDTLPERSLLLAPCGSGKTLAAWRWIASQTKERPVKRVLFLYPTRATATEGFKDYVSWAPEADAALLHGTAGYDLDGMFPAEDPRGAKKFTDTDPRLFALQHWSKRVFAATVDQFFAFMSYAYGPMCLLPLLADSVIVVDEVHSFDRAMFSALLGFLQAFDVPVLCMTATLQKGRVAQLGRLMQRVYGREDRPGDLNDIAKAPRYRATRIVEAEVQHRVRDAVNMGRRVLWVVNQVSRAQAAHKDLAGLSVPVICYHSRFTLDHRVQRHRETVTAIKADQPPAVAVTTQVCEMSLDIDADLLITEECPIPSLIQRMGRCNRERIPRALDRSGEVLIYKPENEIVYKPEHLLGVKDFVDSIVNKTTISQVDLEEELAKAPVHIDSPKVTSFLASGPYALSGDDSFRDIEAFNVQAVLRSEVARYLVTARKDQPGFVLPVPRKHGSNDTRLPTYLFVADDRHYDPLTGFEDNPVR